MTAFAVGMFLFAGCSLGRIEKCASPEEVVRSVFKKGLQHTSPDAYPGILMLHGMSEFAVLEGNEDALNEVVELYKQFGTGEIVAQGNLIAYEAGGSGAAYLAWKKATRALDRQVETVAAEMMDRQNRSPEGLMTAKFATHQVFIDVAFAVTPYLLYAGLKSNNKEYVDFAVFETLELFRILKDEKTGLLHQGRGFHPNKQPEIISEDNWSRGNGWGAFALAILARDLPDSHPQKKEVVELAQRFFTAALNYQDANGLWHQEISDTTSYVETSGSGLLLYGIGILLEKGLLDGKYTDSFVKGLQAYLSYIGSDGSVSHTCRGCLCPGEGTKADYKNRGWSYNDHHAFGPVILAFTQAIKLGIKEVVPSERRGLYTVADSPDVPRTGLRYARGRDIAWENDRIAFRVFGSAVREKAGSGVDVWAKAVAYPVLDKWYGLNEQGQDYHTDRGEGCDFYDMGKRRGCGGLALWLDGKPYPAETFDRFVIMKNQDDGIGVVLHYDTWNVPGLEIREKKEICMKRNTSLFQVTSTLLSPQDRELTVAAGLTTYGKAEVWSDQSLGILSVWEPVDPAHGSLGTGVLVDPAGFAGFASFDGDEFILIKVRTNVPFTYYAGAGWSKSRFFKEKNDWQEYLKKESLQVTFN
jgi:rhamnogalacturonyl hydrolase YesR